MKCLYKGTTFPIRKTILFNNLKLNNSMAFKTIKLHNYNFQSITTIFNHLNMPSGILSRLFAPAPPATVSTICPCSSCFATRGPSKSHSASAATSNRSSGYFTPPPPATTTTICSCAGCYRTRLPDSAPLGTSPSDTEMSLEQLPVYTVANQ